eukprot:s1989_g13.t1
MPHFILAVLVTLSVKAEAQRCEVPVPNAFSCRDLEVWGQFLELLQSNAAAGFPLDSELFEVADILVVQFQTQPDEAHPPEGFFNYLCGGPTETWPLPNKFCLMGYVSALFVRARHLMTMGQAEREAANSDLAYIEPILGKEISLDFLDSSPWPISILDVFLNINQTEFLTYEQYASRNPVRAPAVSLESIHWQMPADIMERLARQATPRDISVAVFGTHATLSLEPVDMLGRSQKIFKLKATFFGVEPRWCEILGLCDLGDSGVTRLLRAAEEDPFAYPWELMSKGLAAVPLEKYALLICTEPVAGCLMLRQLSIRIGQPLPMLGYFGVALLNGCPPQDVPTFWENFKELFGNSAKAILATNNLILSEQIFYQTGHRLPYVRAHGLYTEVTYSPQMIQQVLFWRATVHAAGAVSAAPQLFISTPLEPKERHQEVLPAEPVAQVAQLPRPSLSLRRGHAKEEKEVAPEPQLICTPRTRSPLAVDGEVKSDASKTAKADSGSTRSSISLRPSIKKPDLRRAGSHSSQGSPLPSDGHLNLKIGDVTAPTAPTSKPSNRRPKFQRQMTFAASTKDVESEMRPAKKLFRNATTHFDSKTVTTPEKEKRLAHAVTDPMSGESSPWSRAMTSLNSDSPRAWQEEIAPEAPSEAPSRTTSAVVNLNDLDELGDLPPAEMPVPTEEDVHDLHPTEPLQRARGSYDSLKQSSEGSLQRVPSSSSQRSQRSQSSEPSEHGNLSKELILGFKDKPLATRSHRRPSQADEIAVKGAMRPKKRKNPSKAQLEKPRRGKTAEPRLRRLNSLIELGGARSVSRASSGASGGSRRSSDFKRSPRSSRSPKPSSKEALVQQRQSLRARFASEVPEGELPGRKSGKVTFLRKAWSQARASALLAPLRWYITLQQFNKKTAILSQDDNDPRAKGLRGWDAARALCVGTGRALKDVKNVVSLVKKAADEAYHRHRVQKAIVEEIGTTLRGSMANVSNEMDETIGDVLADLTRLKWLDMTEIGALVCEAILNFDEDENKTITSPASLRDQLLQHCQSLPNREEVLGMDDGEIESLLDNIMHQTERLRDQLRTSVCFSLPDEDAHQHQHHRSKLRQMDSSRLSGMDTLEVAVEERESVESILSRMGSRVDTEPKPLLNPVQEAAAAAAAPKPETPRAPLPVPRILRPATQSPRPRTADKSREENEADDLPLLVSSSSTLPREPRKMPRPTRKQLEMAGFSHAAGLLEVSPLFAYATLRCALYRFLEGIPQYPLNFYFLEGTESVPYKKAASFRAVALLPQDHALMSFFELYSANIPLLMPSAEWMYRLLYMRGQLSVGERWYQSIMPGHEPPFCEFEEADANTTSGTPTAAWGVSAAKAARAAAVQTLRRIVTATDLETAKSMAEATLGLMEDQKFFLAVAANETDQDSATSMGVVRRSHHDTAGHSGPRLQKKGAPWHPYTPFQMSTRDSNDWTRMRKGGWWLRRGHRFDAMRYWHQFSDFARFPGLQYFANIPELLCQAQVMDIPAATQAMYLHNQATLAHSSAFWAHAILELLA